MQEIDATLQALAHRAVQAPPDVRARVAAALRRALGIVEGERAVETAITEASAALELAAAHVDFLRNRLIGRHPPLRA